MKTAAFCLLLALAGVLPASPADRPEDARFYDRAVYREDFESGELRAWASYPPNQDTAYDPCIYPGRIRPEERGTSLVVKCEPLWNEDQELGAVKLLDMVLDRDFSLRFRFEIKTTDSCPGLAVSFALADGRKLVLRLPDPAVNRWTDVAVGWRDLADRGLVGGAETAVRLTALAVTANVTKADQDMPIYFALDDIELAGLRPKEFRFVEPEVVTLGEWPEKIAVRHFRSGESLRIRGAIDAPVDSLEFAVARFENPGRIVQKGPLRPGRGGAWSSSPVELKSPSFRPGLYVATVLAAAGGRRAFGSAFTFFVVAPGGVGSHPRLLFDAAGLDSFRARLGSERFRPVLERFLSRAAGYRKSIAPAALVFDIDQFPANDWLATIGAWYTDRFMAWREALFTNAVVQAFGGSDAAAAGAFVRALLLKLAAWPQWNHPWMEARGFHTYYPIGEFADACAVAYDVACGTMTDTERRAVRKGLFRNFVRPAFRTYVEQNQVTSNSSNWISHIAGGGLAVATALSGDDPADGDLEPWLTGFILKARRYISTVFGRDGSYGEGYRYYNFAMQSLSRSLPALKRVMGVDLAGPIRGSYAETLWASIVPANAVFSFGDTEGYLKKEAAAWWIGGENGPMNNWAWLLSMTRDPDLAFLYRSLKEKDTLQEVLHETDGIEASDPSRLGGVRFFPDVGTAVFKSGWGTADFLFVFRSGPFFNHQHMDQGSFFLADRGRIFLEERYDGEHHYYDDPLYRSYAIQALSHNTILIDGNPQSQKTGDPAGFAPGMTDQAVFLGGLDSRSFAYAGGELEKIYKGKIRKLARHVLYVKPRSVLIVDEAVPEASDVEIDLLFHTRRKTDIVLRPGVTEIARGDAVLRMWHLGAAGLDRRALTEPHFLCEYATAPLEERGYLRVSRRTEGRRLVLAEFLSASPRGEAAPVSVTDGGAGSLVESRVGGRGAKLTVSGGDFCRIEELSSDALFLARDDAGGIFLAEATKLEKSGRAILMSSTPLTAFIREAGGRLEIESLLGKPSRIRLEASGPAGAVLVDGKAPGRLSREKTPGAVVLDLPAGRSRVVVE